MSRPRTITERNMAIQQRAQQGVPLDKLALEYGLAKGTVYMITNKRKPKREQRPDDTDPFIRLTR